MLLRLAVLLVLGLSLGIGGQDGYSDGHPRTGGVSLGGSYVGGSTHGLAGLNGQGPTLAPLAPPPAAHAEAGERSATVSAGDGDSGEGLAGWPREGNRDSALGTLQDPATLICASFTTWRCDEALAVARCESGLDPDAFSNGNYGLFQIAQIHRAKVDGDLSRLFNAAENVRVAHDLWSDTQDWRAWACKPNITLPTTGIGAN